LADKKKKIIALFNYGGGMRGLIPAYIMSKIEEKTGLRMVDMVDVFTGPSTGAILNTALNIPHPDKPSRPKFRARHMVRFYEREGIKIFPPDQFRSFRGIIHDFNNRTLNLTQLNWLFRHGHYDPAHLSKSLRALYGEHNLNETLRSLVIPVYNIDGEQLQLSERQFSAHENFLDDGGHAVWLKNLKIDGDKKMSPAPDVSLYDAVMASCAAPTYFPCHHFDIKYSGKENKSELTAIDGSVFDNPCTSYLGAIRRHIPEGHELVMIVLGTGYTNRSFKKDDWNRFGSIGVVDPVNDLPLINIFFHASETALIESFREEMGENLFVFNKSIIHHLDDPEAPSTQIDDASPQNLKALRHFFEIIMEENESKFEKVCNLLVANYEEKNAGKDAESSKALTSKNYLKLLKTKKK
jgi:predicted acylesterase/phospholipase RssA